jgi:hypothetical protein
MDSQNAGGVKRVVSVGRSIFDSLRVGDSRRIFGVNLADSDHKGEDAKRSGSSGTSGVATEEQKETSHRSSEAWRWVVSVFQRLSQLVGNSNEHLSQVSSPSHGLLIARKRMKPSHLRRPSR